MNSSFSRAQAVMFNRYTKKAHDLLEEQVIKHEYSDQNTWGFRLIQRRPTFFLAEYIEKQLRAETIIDPFGEESIYERTVYISAPFMVKTTAPNLIILDPPKIYRKVIHRLCELSDFSISAEEPNLNVHDWAQNLVAGFDDFKLTKTQLRNIEFGDGFTGACSISGEGNLIKKIADVTNKRKYTLSSFSGYCSIENRVVGLSIHSSGRIKTAKPIGADAYVKLFMTYRDWNDV